MRRTIRALLGAACAAAALSAPADAAVQVSQSGWFWGNPTPQGNTLRALDFLSGRGYAVGDAGTALRTDDGGATWTGLATGTSADLDRLQVVTPDTLVVQGGDGCVLRRSDDGGRTFHRVYVLAERGCPNPVQAAYFVDAQIGYVLLRDGSVLRTADAGETFAKQTAVPGTPASTGGGSVAPVDLVFTSADRGLAFVALSGGATLLYETTDQGISWKPLDLPPGVTRVSRVTFLDAQNAYAVGPDTLLRSVDGGETWTRRAAGAGQELTSVRCATGDTCLLTVKGGDRLLRTTDGGATVTPITAATQAIFVAAFASPTRVVAGGAGGATVVSDDGGVNYTPVGGDIGATYVALRRGPSPQIAYALGRNGQLARTADGGANWRALSVPTSAELGDVSFASSELGYALDVRGGLFKTANGGQSWQTLDPGTTAAPLALAALGENVVLLAGPRGVRRQVGGGRFDAVTDRDVATARLSDLDAANGAVVAFGAQALALSADRGATWRRIVLPNPSRRKRNPLRVRDVDFVDVRAGWLLDDAGRLWATRDGGRSWGEIAATGSDDAQSIAFGSRTEGWLTVGDFAADPRSAFVLRTGDGGRTWRPQRLSVGAPALDGVVAAGGRQAYALTVGPAQQRQLFGTTTGGDAGDASRLTLTVPARRFTRRSLRRAGGQLTIRGTLAGAQGGEQVVVSRRDARGGRWIRQVVTAGANGGSFTATFRLARSSYVVAQWAGDSGRTGAGTRVLGISVR
ncbi:MAG TPA: YCF48-related protein [Solirubrobacteraceae bacterium]